MDDLYRKQLLRMNKAELIQECMNQNESSDINYDLYLNAKADLAEMELYDDAHLELEKIKGLIHRLKTSRMRYSLGIESEKEEMDKILNLILEIKT